MTKNIGEKSRKLEQQQQSNTTRTMHQNYIYYTFVRVRRNQSKDFCTIAIEHLEDEII